jgi:hypothetical protein
VHALTEILTRNAMVVICLLLRQAPPEGSRHAPFFYLLKLPPELSLRPWGRRLFSVNYLDIIQESLFKEFFI